MQSGGILRKDRLMLLRHLLQLSIMTTVIGAMHLFCPLMHARAEAPRPEKTYGTIAGRFTETALSDYSGYRMLRELCEMGPRLSGSENSLKAIFWVWNKMKEFRFDRVWLQPVIVPHWVRGDSEEAEIISGNHAGKQIRIGALGGSVPTPPKGIAARVLEVRSFAELRERRDEAPGKIIFFNHPMAPESIDTFAAYSDAVRYRAFGASETAKAGGIAAIVRSVTTKNDDNPHVGMMEYEENIGRVPTAAVSVAGAEFLSAALAKEPELMIRLTLSCRTLPDAESYNVIGELTGSVLPNEVIVVGGHFDSWDVGEGAHDCGGGCIQSMEVLDLFRRLGIRPKRTIRCVLFINEENGLRGAREYAQYAGESKQETHIAAIESDRGLFTPRGFYVDADSSALKKMESWLPFLGAAGIEWVRHGEGGPDVQKINAARARVDYVPDCQRYFDVHHSDNDVFEAVHPREMELGSAALAILAYMLSEEGL